MNAQIDTFYIKSRLGPNCEIKRGKKHINFTKKEYFLESVCFSQMSKKHKKFLT